MMEKSHIGPVFIARMAKTVFGRPIYFTASYTVDGLLIDTGPTVLQAEVLVFLHNKPVDVIVNTHHHEDHSGNAAAIRLNYGAAVYGHSLTREKMKTPFKIPLYQKYVWGKSTPLEMELFPEKIESVLGEMVPVHTPGHAKDHTVFFLQDAGVLFSGDLYLADKIKFFRSDEEVGTQILSLKKILELDFDILLCSHYPKLENGKRRIKSKLAFLEELHGNIIKFYEKGYSEKQIFKALKLKEDYFVKYFCFGNVSMLNSVRSVLRHYDLKMES